MSAFIDVNKLNFTVFGRGYDDDRGNSGEGYLEPDSTGIDVVLAEFDETGQFCWINDGGWHGNVVHKYETENWTSVEQGSVPYLEFITHPHNVENNIGYVGYGNTVCLFDMTTNEIIKTGSVSNLWHGGRITDCTLDEDNNLLHYVRLYRNRENTTNIYTLDIDNLSGSNIGDIYDRSNNGFIDIDSAFVKYPPEWFNQWWWASALNVNGSTEWGITATDDSTHAFTNVGYNCWGLCGRGKIYLPSYIGDEWVMGEYSGASTPDLITPTPIKTYGHFDSKPAISEAICYSNGKKKGAFSCGEGTFVCDMENGSLAKITADVETVRAMTDNMLICANGKVYYF